MTRDELLRDLGELKINQSILADLLGVRISTVSRFGSSRADGVPIPRYVISFLAAFRAMPAANRKKLVAEFRVSKKKR